MSPTAILRVQNTIFNDSSAINNNFASQRQNYAQKMQVAQVTKSLSPRGRDDVGGGGGGGGGAPDKKFATTLLHAL